MHATSLLRCFLDLPEILPGECALPENEARHLGQVRRAGPGDPVRVLNGRGAVGEARILEIGRRGGTLLIESVQQIPAPAPAITLAISALKQSAWDDVLKHAVELGVNRILRVQSQNTVADLDAARAAAKCARWRELMIEAVKQSANPWLPDLVLADSVAHALDLTRGQGVHLAALLTPEASPLPTLDPAAACVVWIGPEGDFTPAESKSLLEAGAHAVSLGPRILRAETAALALVAALRLQVR